MATFASLPFGPYRALAPLAEGPGDEVWLALAPPDDLCVLKLLREGPLADEVLVSRFLQHAERWRAIDHPNLVRTIDVGDVDGEPYMAQELVDGHDLATIRERLAELQQPLSVEAAVHVVTEVAAALEHLHGLQTAGLDGNLDANLGSHLEPGIDRPPLGHGGLRPTQVRVTYDGRVKLLDGGVPLGDSGGAPARADDLRALAVLLWELLSGRPIGARLAGTEVVLAEGPRAEAVDLVVREPPPAPSLFRAWLAPELDQLVLAVLAGRAPFPDTPGALARALAPFVADPAASRAELAALLAATFSPGEERAHREELVERARAEMPAAEVITAKVTGRSGEDRPSLSHHRGPLIALGIGTAAAIAVVLLAKAPDVPPTGAAGPPAPATITRAPPMPGLAEAPAAPPTRPAPRREPVSAPDWPAAAPPPVPSVATSPSGADPRPAPSIAGDPARRAAVATSGRKAPPPATRRAPAAPPEPAASQPAPASAPAGEDDANEKLLHLDHARAAFARGDLPEALSSAKKAVGGDERAHALLGAIYFKLGRYGESEEQYAVALEKAPGDPRIARRLDLVRRRAAQTQTREQPQPQPSDGDPAP